MLALQLGPLALPTAPLLLLASLLLAQWLAPRLLPAGAAPLRPQAGQALLNAGFVGLLAARLAHLGLHLPAYASSPWAMLDVRDGGWHWPTGLLLGLAWLAWQMRRQPGPLRRALAGAALAGLALWGAGQLWLARQSETPLPALLLQRLESEQRISLAALAAGQPLVVNLWASWCGPCRAEMPVLAAAQRQQAGRIGFAFVNSGESAEQVRAWLQRQGLSLQQVLLDHDAALGPLVGSSGLPTTLFYDAQGRLQHAHMGMLNSAALQARLDALLPLSAAAGPATRPAGSGSAPDTASPTATGATAAAPRPTP